MKIEVKGIDKVVKDLRKTENDLPQKIDKLLERLSFLGAFRARTDFSRAMYAGTNDTEIEVVETADGFSILASGKAVLFIEFGTGVLNPEHPQSGEFGFKHGTYGLGQGANPKGWVYTGEQGNAGRPIRGREGIYRTYGNPPAMAMWNSAKEMRKEIKKIAREVFSDG